MRSTLFNQIFQRFQLKKPHETGINSGGDKKTTWIKKYGLKIGAALLFAVLLTLLFPRGKSFQFADLKEGRVYIGQEIIAPFTFPVNKSEQEYNQDIITARENVAPVFQRDPAIETKQLEELAQFIGRVQTILKDNKSLFEDLETVVRESGIALSKENISLLWSGFTDQQPPAKQQKNFIKNRLAAFNQIAQTVEPIVKELYSAGILDLEKKNLQSPQGKISVRENGQEMLEDLNFYQDLKESYDNLLEKLRAQKKLDDKKIKIAYQIADHFLVPNVLFDKEETDSRIEDAIANVPLAKDQVLAGERIIDSHERVTKEVVAKLNSLAIAKAERGEAAGFWSKMAPGIGKFFFILCLLTILVIILYRYHKEILEDNNKLVLIALNIFVIAFLTFLLNRFELSVYLIPVAMGAIIITIFFDIFVGFLFSITTSFLIGGMRGDEFGITFVSLFVCSIAVLSVSRVRTRNWVLRSIALIAFAYIFSASVHNLVSYVGFQETLRDWGFGIINGFLAPIFAYGLIIILEFVFDMTTDMTLLELSDLNQPLLRQLAIRAPGTYHHSIMVGNLAEAATEAIGGNALLARVGSYYHDIGKMEKPEYFVENQIKGRNPQEKLTPSMSSLILGNHVRKGAEMARQHNLPKEIEAFIYQHHGTSLMKYFYQKALENSTEEQVSENEFRYPGPRPQSRETAIVMMADAVEAASRTLKDPPPSRIKGLVEQLIDERFKSGELDDSPLTLHDLHKISDAFQKILNGVFHGRIEYPTIKPKEQSKQKSESKNNK
ncbi:MAG: HDIG domain-containing protein [Actinobacteria bacterium]|nr:HDIG domain-containing protein [Actinomycetota bacterium]